MAQTLQMVSTYVRTCESFQRVKPSAHSAAPFVNLPVPTRCWELHQYGFCVWYFQECDGIAGILVPLDRLRQMAHLAPLPDFIDVKGTSMLFIDSVFRLHGLRLTIISDHNHRLTKMFWTSIFKGLGTLFEHVHSGSSAYRRLN